MLKPLSSSVLIAPEQKLLDKIGAFVAGFLFSMLLMSGVAYIMSAMNSTAYLVVGLVGSALVGMQVVYANIEAHCHLDFESRCITIFVPNRLSSQWRYQFSDISAVHVERKVVRTLFSAQSAVELRMYADGHVVYGVRKWSDDVVAIARRLAAESEIECIEAGLLEGDCGEILDFVPFFQKVALPAAEHVGVIPADAEPGGCIIKIRSPDVSHYFRDFSYPPLTIQMSEVAVICEVRRFSRTVRREFASAGISKIRVVGSTGRFGVVAGVHVCNGDQYSVLVGAGECAFDEIMWMASMLGQRLNIPVEAHALVVNQFQSPF